MDIKHVAPQTRPPLLGLAVASLTFSCLGIFIGPLLGPFLSLFLLRFLVPFASLLLAFLGVVCGHLARRTIRRNPDFRGSGMALAGLIIGYVYLGIILTLIFIMMFLVFLPIIGAFLPS